MKGNGTTNTKLQNKTVLFILAITLTIFINEVQSQTRACCCNSFLLIAPNSVVEECLYQHDHFTTQWTEDYTGYASAVDACAFNGVGQPCAGCDCVNPPGWYDVYNIAHTSDSRTQRCGNTISITRQFCEICGGNPLCVYQDIDIVDSIEPELTVPADKTVECVSYDGVAGADFDIRKLDGHFGSARATDLCTNPTLSEQTQSTGDSCALSIERTFTADDGCNTSEDTQFVFFVDTTPPVLSTTSPRSYYTCDQTTLIGQGNNVPTAVDSCDNLSGATPTPVDVRFDGQCAGDYSIERTWSLSDKCNNKGTLKQVIIVTDVDPPSVTTSGGAPAGVNTYTEVSCTVPPPNSYVVTDACGGEVFTSYEERINGLNDLSNYYDLVRSYYAADDCGNSLRWEEVYRVDIGSNVLFTSPSREISTSKGVNIQISFALTGRLCKEGYVVFDIGAADFISSTLNGCTGSNGGAIYCPVDPSSVLSLSFNLVIYVNPNYAPDYLQIRYSFAESDPTNNIIKEGATIVLQFA